jgi:hypothetical protein
MPAAYAQGAFYALQEVAVNGFLSGLQNDATGRKLGGARINSATPSEIANLALKPAQFS